MNIQQLQFLSVEELTKKKEQADIAEAKAQEELEAAAGLRRACEVALACHYHGAWIGDTVQVKGRYQGKDNPTGVLADIENPHFMKWPLVRLHRKDGSPSEVATRIWCEIGKPLTKIDPL